jgi:hypothetical protein
MWHVHLACRITSATNTHLECVLYLLLFHGNSGWANVLQCYVDTYIACLDGFYDHFTSASWHIDMVFACQPPQIMNLKDRLLHKWFSGGMVIFLNPWHTINHISFHVFTVVQLRFPSSGIDAPSPGNLFWLCIDAASYPRRTGSSEWIISSRYVTVKNCFVRKVACLILEDILGRSPDRPWGSSSPL